MWWEALIPLVIITGCIMGMSAVTSYMPSTNIVSRVKRRDDFDRALDMRHRTLNLPLSESFYGKKYKIQRTKPKETKKETKKEEQKH